MLKKTALFLFQLFFFIAFSQNNLQWKGYFSYNHITALTESPNMIYGASETNYFKQNLTSNDLTTINSIDGLKAVSISAFYHSNTVNKTFVGNTNGLLLIVNADGSILYKGGILTEVPVSPLIKKINNFIEDQGKIYISCDYGISVFDLSTMEFGQNYFIGSGGNYLIVNQTCVNNGFIYAATNNGLKKASITNPFLDDWAQWTDVSTGVWKGVVTFNANVFAVRSDNVLLKYDGTTLSTITTIPDNVLTLKATDNYLIVACPNTVFVFNQALLQLVTISTNQYTNSVVTFTCATIINDKIFIGTNQNGVLSSSISSPTAFQVIKPDGPIKNNIFRLKKSSKKLWAMYGRYSTDYNAFVDLNNYPISLYSPQTGWSLISNSALFGAQVFSNLAFSPYNEDVCYVSSGLNGLVKIENEVPTLLYNETNTGSDGLTYVTNNGAQVQINGPAYDKNGNLWMTNNLSAKPIKVLKSNNQWQSYAIPSISVDQFYASLIVDKNNTKWIPTQYAGLVGFNEGLNNKTIIITESTGGNLPSHDVRCVAVDNKNELWIGTNNGLRVVQSVDSFLSQTDIQSTDIVINENIDGQNLAQELFYNQFIIDIAVDGANQKWFSTSGSGVYLMSPNGQTTLYHFTTDNSPLPSNIVNDIEIDGATGEVYFATDKGLVSFKGSATQGSDDLSNVFIYPNPVRPEYTGTVKISGLMNKSTVKITDVEGNLVFEATSEGGTVEWDTTAFSKYKVVSGVYVVLVSGSDGTLTTTDKVMIVR